MPTDSAAQMSAGVQLRLEALQAGGVRPAGSTAPIPEPASGLTLGAGGLRIGWTLRRHS